MTVRVFIVVLLALAIYISRAFANPFPLQSLDFTQDLEFLTVPEISQPKTHYGFSYSFEQAGWYGLDSRKAYLDLISNYNFGWVRLPFFWDQMVDSNGNPKLDDLRFAIEEANKRNKKVVVVLGVKTPYYPEFHWPKNIASQVAFGTNITDSHPVAGDILEIDRKVVAALSAYPNISHWQIENEPFLANINRLTIDETLLTREIEVVRMTDSKKRPIILSNAARASYDKNYIKLLDLLNAGDILGVNAYFKTQGVDLLAFPAFGKEFHLTWPKWFTWPVQSWLFLSPDYERIKMDAAKKGVDVWIMEMQSEPYIRVIEEAGRSGFAYSADDLVKADQFVRTKGFEHIGFWGVHFWQYREQAGDKSWVQTAKKIVND